MNKILLSFVSNPYYNAKSYLFYHLEKKEMNNFTANSLRNKKFENYTINCWLLGHNAY